MLHTYGIKSWSWLMKACWHAVHTTETWHVIIIKVANSMYSKQSLWQSYSLPHHTKPMRLKGCEHCSLFSSTLNDYIAKQYSRCCSCYLYTSTLSPDSANSPSFSINVSVLFFTRETIWNKQTNKSLISCASTYILATYIQSSNCQQQRGI